VRGLSVGSSVEFRGIPVGKVENIDIKMNQKTLDIRIPVLVSIQPQQFDDAMKLDEAEEAMRQLVKKGLRAKLETGSFLTGQKIITLSLEKDAKPVDIVKTQFYAEFPTVSGDLDDLAGMASHMMTSLQETLDGIKKLVNSGKLDKAVDNLNKVLTEAELAVKAAKEAIKTVDKKTLPGVQHDLDKITVDLAATLQKIQGSMGQIDRLTAQNSPTQYQLQEMLEEVTAASRSVRSLTETLQRQPTSLIRGKKGDE
jgi:paraquat-inducible protein B